MSSNLEEDIFLYMTSICNIFKNVKEKQQNFPLNQNIWAPYQAGVLKSLTVSPMGGLRGPPQHFCECSGNVISRTLREGFPTKYGGQQLQKALRICQIFQILFSLPLSVC